MYPEYVVCQGIVPDPVIEHLLKKGATLFKMKKSIFKMAGFNEFRIPRSYGIKL
jgi:hypothetical protein